MDHREVELRAQSGENSQLFMDSQFNGSTAQGGMQMINRFNNLDGFGPGEFDDDRDINIAGATGQQQKITVNLEDAVLEEQKLNQILEVSLVVSL